MEFRLAASTAEAKVRIRPWTENSEVAWWRRTRSRMARSGFGDETELVDSGTTTGAAQLERYARRVSIEGQYTSLMLLDLAKSWRVGMRRRWGSGLDFGVGSSLLKLS